MKDENAIWKPLPLPKEDCTYQGTCDDGRIICDEMGDDVSPEFCHYCRYLAKTYDKKPHEVASILWEVVSELKFPRCSGLEWHNLPNLKDDTKCKWCGKTVEELKNDRRLK